MKDRVACNVAVQISDLVAVADDQIERYHHGSMPATEIIALERHGRESALDHVVVAIQGHEVKCLAEDKHATYPDHANHSEQSQKRAASKIVAKDDERRKVRRGREQGHSNQDHEVVAVNRAGPSISCHELLVA
jgi:hypothetical protein